MNRYPVDHGLDINEQNTSGGGNQSILHSLMTIF